VAQSVPTGQKGETMLVLTRRVDEEIVIDNQVRVRVMEIRGDRVRLGIVAPASVRVDRQEVHERRGIKVCSFGPDVENDAL
jgi:carbon storage regulator